MLLGLAYQLIRFIADLMLHTRSDAQLRAEVLALRRQLRVLEHRVGKPAWHPGGRRLLAPQQTVVKVRLVCPGAEAGDLAPLAPRSGPL